MSDTLQPTFTRLHPDLLRPCADTARPGTWYQEQAYYRLRASVLQKLELSLEEWEEIKANTLRYWELPQVRRIGERFGVPVWEMRVFPLWAVLFHYCGLTDREALFVLGELLE